MGTSFCNLFFLGVYYSIISILYKFKFLPTSSEAKRSMWYMTILLHQSIHFLHKSKSLQNSHSPVRQHTHRSLHYRNSLHKYSLYHVTFSVRYTMTYLCWLGINVCSGLCICVLGSSTEYNMISTVLYSFSSMLQPCKKHVLQVSMKPYPPVPLFFFPILLIWFSSNIPGNS